MNTIDRAITLKKDKYTCAVFQGECPWNKLRTSVSSFPALFIANMDTSEKPGSHWITFHFTKDQKGGFFDSYGLPPSNYTGTFSSFLNNNSNYWSFNPWWLDGRYIGHTKRESHFCSVDSLYLVSSFPAIKLSLHLGFFMLCISSLFSSQFCQILLSFQLLHSWQWHRTQGRILWIK